MQCDAVPQHLGGRVVHRPAPGSGLPRNGLMEAAGPSFIAQLVVLAMKDPGVVARVVADGGQPNYEVKMFPVLPNSPQLPLLMVEATEPDPASSQKTVQVVSQQVPVVLRQVQAQAGVPDELQVRGISPAPPSPPVAAAPSRTKSGVALILGGVLLSILAAVIVDTVRTPIGKRKGALATWHPADLLGFTLKALLDVANEALAYCEWMVSDTTSGDVLDEDMKAGRSRCNHHPRWWHHDAGGNL